MKALIGLAALAAVGLAGCNSSPITAAICSDASALQASTVAMNKNQQLALTGIVSTCGATVGGTVFNNTTLVAALISDALLLQGSGLLSDVHITAQAPEAQVTLKKIKLHWEKLSELR